MIKEKLQKLCEKRAASQQTQTKQENLSSFLGQPPCSQRVFCSRSCVQPLQTAWTKSCCSECKAVSKCSVEPGLGIARVCAAGGREHRDIELMLGTISAALKLSKYISFYPFTGSPLPEPLLHSVNHPLPLVVCVQVWVSTHIEQLLNSTQSAAALNGTCHPNRTGT